MIGLPSKQNKIDLKFNIYCLSKLNQYIGFLRLETNCSMMPIAQAQEQQEVKRKTCLILANPF